VNIRTGFALAFYMTVFGTLFSAISSLIVEKEINWIITFSRGFGTFYGAIIGLGIYLKMKKRQRPHFLVKNVCSR